MCPLYVHVCVCFTLSRVTAVILGKAREMCLCVRMCAAEIENST